MREKTIEQEYLDFSRKSTVKVVHEYRRKYEVISEVLEANPKVLDLAHEDFRDGLSESERRIHVGADPEGSHSDVHRGGQLPGSSGEDREQ